MRVSVIMICQQAYLFEQLDYFFFAFIFIVDDIVNLQGFCNGRAYCKSRVQRRVWVLENYLYLFTELFKFIAFFGGQVDAIV
jgi:hypothetical protein